MALRFRGGDHKNKSRRTLRARKGGVSADGENPKFKMCIENCQEGYRAEKNYCRENFAHPDSATERKACYDKADAKYRDCCAHCRVMNP